MTRSHSRKLSLAERCLNWREVLCILGCKSERGCSNQQGDVKRDLKAEGEKNMSTIGGI